MMGFFCQNFNEESKFRQTKEKKRFPWTQQEDEKLEFLVKGLGMSNWSIISKDFENRNGKSCRSSWVNKLDPTVSTKPFSAVEKEIIIAKHAELGNKWSEIAKFLPGRTDMAVKNQWNGSLKNKIMGIKKGKKAKRAYKRRNVQHQETSPFKIKDPLEKYGVEYKRAFDEHTNIIRKLKDAHLECFHSLMEYYTMLAVKKQEFQAHQQATLDTFHDHTSQFHHLVSHNKSQKKFNCIVDSLATIIEFFSELYGENKEDIINICKHALELSSTRGIMETETNCRDNISVNHLNTFSNDIELVNDTHYQKTQHLDTDMCPIIKINNNNDNFGLCGEICSIIPVSLGHPHYFPSGNINY